MSYTNELKPSDTFTNDSKPSDTYDNDNKGGTTIEGTPMGLLLALTQKYFNPNSYTNEIKP